MEKRGIQNIVGNHELADFDKDIYGVLSPHATRSLEQTLKYLTYTSLCYIGTLPRYLEMEGALMVHGCPPDSPEVYLNHMDLSEIRKVFASNRFDILRGAYPSSDAHTL